MWTQGPAKIVLTKTVHSWLKLFVTDILHVVHKKGGSGSAFGVKRINYFLPFHWLIACLLSWWAETEFLTLCCEYADNEATFRQATGQRGRNSLCCEQRERLHCRNAADSGRRHL